MIHIEKLAAQAPSSKEPVMILHGLFGSGSNWKSIAKAISAHRTVYLLDARNHGQSFHSANMTYKDMTQDLMEVMESEKLNQVNLVGHSMGGKTAMNAMIHYPNKITSAVIVDIAPIEYPPHHDDILAGIQALSGQTIQSRSEADQRLATYVSESAVRQFLLKSMKRDESDGQYKWCFGAREIRDAYANILAPISGPVCSNPITFIRGGESDYIQQKAIPIIKAQFPKAKVLTVEGAGHWVHGEKPGVVITHILEALASA